MTRILLPLMGITLCAATLQSAAADSAVLLQHGEESHAVVTDIPDVIDMSYANPKTWDRLLLAPPVNDWSSEVLAISLKTCRIFGSRARFASAKQRAA
jgi:hypothetical protein